MSADHAVMDPSVTDTPDGPKYWPRCACGWHAMARRNDSEAREATLAHVHRVSAHRGPEVDGIPLTAREAEFVRALRRIDQP